MRLVRGFLLAILLAAALWREPTRAHAEREIRAATEALRYVLLHSNDLPDAPGALDRISLVATAAEPALPGDPRPVLLEGAARLVNGQGERALDAYRRALALGERGETDLNLGRALERVGREAEARAAFVRAAWISPPLLASMLPDVAAAAQAEVSRLETELREGRLKAPPPLPVP
jgi:tetratricopeptide (TPR) repeat protein